MSELRMDTLNLPASELGPESPLPPIGAAADIHAAPVAAPDVPEDMRSNMAYGRVAHIMPYAMQDGYGRKLQTREFRIAVLENEILRAAFMLEFGGRLWSLIHKPTGRELLYTPPVFQFGNLALRNAWFCGGVEWNIGTIGHGPFTSSPVFAARAQRPDGTPVLRLYEWERMRQVPFQIDACLPSGSPVLFVYVRIANPHERVTPMYWWSNIAVPERPDLRTLVPARKAYTLGYDLDGLGTVKIPCFGNTDVSRPVRVGKSTDFFFHVPDGKRPWIATLDRTGKGLVQTSTQRLRGRKLFVWGMGEGGRHWQEFLTGSDQGYSEIQAGLARTQLEHLPMPPRTSWSWLECYGLMDADPVPIHGEDWDRACKVAEAALEALAPASRVEDEFGRAEVCADQPPDDILQEGSGWGALEQRRRQVEGKPPLCSVGLVFKPDSLAAEQRPWLELLNTGIFPCPPPNQPPNSHMAQAEWRDLLENAVRETRNDHWFAWYHLGVLRFLHSDPAGAREAWTRSLERTESAWALRNLAVLCETEQCADEAVRLSIAALRLQPEQRPLAIECGRALMAANRPAEWLEALNALPPAIRQAGRIRLLEAQAALAVGQIERTGRLLQGLIVEDIKELETSPSDLWFAYHERRLALEENRPLDLALRQRVRREFPVPREMDFRMFPDNI